MKLLRKLQNTTMNKLHIVISDLDGTLLPRKGSISKSSINTFTKLKDKKIIRVIATGRNLFSCMEVLNDNFPIDYLIFASGGGIMRWEDKKIIYSESLNAETVFKTASILFSEKIDFTIQKPIPENHKFLYHNAGNKNIDFNDRVNIYKPFATKINSINDTKLEASQLLAILPGDVNKFELLKKRFSNIKIIRATSPLDDESIWMEFFPTNVSKAKASQWLCNTLGIKQEMTFTIGNDYNDVDMLDWSKHSFVVENAPQDMKEKYKICPSVLQNGFAKAVECFI